MSASVQVTVDEGVAVVRLDDGKANALSHEVIRAMHDALDQSLADARSVCIVGRPDKLCAGFDLAEMTKGGDATRGLVKAGGELLMRLYGHPQPTVVAVTGHALAAGALLVLACDTRIGAADVPAKIGLNETAIGMGLPVFAIELARERLPTQHLTAATLQARIYDPAGALDAGYLDALVPAAELEETAVAEARRLGELPSNAYRSTKRQTRQSVIEKVLAGLDADMMHMVPPTPA
jgi:enoyl-CoA hydratase